MHLLRFLAALVLVACPSLAVAQVVVLDSFDAGSATGSPRPGTTWVGNVTANAGTVTVGGAARDDNGWGATGLNINATGLNFLSIVAQRDPGHAGTSVVLQLEDRNLNTQVFSVSASAFAIGSLTEVQVPLSGWSTGFDRTAITGWTLGGGSVGTAAFRMTFDRIALSATASSTAPVVPSVSGSYGSSARAPGEAISFTVVAAGSGPLTYQWRKDNVPVAGNPTAATATLALAALTALDAGTYTCVVANAAGSVTSGGFVLTVAGTPAAVALSGLSQTYTGTPRPVAAATNPAGLPVTVTYNNSAVAPTAAGSYAVVATVAHPTYVGRAEGMLVVGRAPQSIAIGALPATIAIGAPVTLSATSASGGDVVFAVIGGSAELTGNVLVPRGAAPITLRATQAGDANFLPASIDFAFTTARQNQSIAFSAPGAQVAGTAVTLSATATSNLPVQFSVVSGPANLAGNSLTPTAAGLVVVRASQPGNDSFNPAPHVDRSFAVTAPEPPPAGPVVVRGPVSQSVEAGAPLSLSVEAAGSAPLAYQWFKDDVALPGATLAVYTVARAAAETAGRYHVAVTNAVATVRSAAATVTVTAPPPPAVRLANFSTRARAGTGEQVAIAGFALAGTAPKRVLVRAVGPALAGFGVDGALAAPVLEVFDAQSRSVARNAGWSAQPDAAAVAAAAAQIGAFALGATSADSALVLTLSPGAYTAVISAGNDVPGIGLVEVYDLSTPAPGQQIANLSIRATAGAEADTLIVGIVVEGTGTRRVLVRAAGPALGAFGVSGFLARPQLAVFGGQREIARNVGWSTAADSAALARTAARVGAFAFAADSADSALILDLPPGAYTAHVSGVPPGTGVALVEVYEVP